jgi:uncharacterized C2H2 Zn-finger protein
VECKEKQQQKTRNSENNNRDDLIRHINKFALFLFDNNNYNKYITKKKTTITRGSLMTGYYNI